MNQATGLRCLDRIIFVKWRNEYFEWPFQAETEDEVARMIQILVNLSALIVAGGICGTCQGQNASTTKQFSAITVYARSEAMRPDRCPGFYGFSVASDGKFKVGPSPNGSIIEGSVTADELTTLTSAVNAQLASGNKVTCLDIHTLPGSGRVIAASFTDGSRVNLRTVGLILGSHGNCALGDYQKAQLVDEIVRKLMMKYYPQTFPIQ